MNWATTHRCTVLAASEGAVLLMHDGEELSVWTKLEVLPPTDCLIDADLLYGDDADDTQLLGWRRVEARGRTAREAAAELVGLPDRDPKPDNPLAWLRAEYEGTFPLTIGQANCLDAMPELLAVAEAARTPFLRGDTVLGRDTNVLRAALATLDVRLREMMEAER